MNTQTESTDMMSSCPVTAVFTAPDGHMERKALTGVSVAEGRSGEVEAHLAARRGL